MDDSDSTGNVPYNDIHRFFEVSPDLLAISVNGLFVRLNPAWEKTLGYSIEELTSQPASSFIHPDDAADLDSISQQMVEGGGLLMNYENRYRHKDGSYRWLEWTARRFPGEETTYCVARDITSRKEDREALRQSQESMRALLDGMSSLAIMVQVDGMVVAINQSAAAVYGRSIDEIVGQNIYSLTDDEDSRRESQLRAQHIIEAGKPLHVEAEREGQYFDTSITPIRDNNGKVVSLVTTAHDITYLKKIEIALRQSERTLREFIDSSPDGALLIDPDGIVIAGNQKLPMGHVNENVGRNIYEILPAEYGHRRREAVAQVLATRKPVSYQDQDGGRYFDQTVTPIFDDNGNIHRIAVFVHYITQMKLTEIALRKSEQHFRSVLESAAEGILLTTESGEITLVNKELERQFGYTRDELLGHSVDILLPEAQREVHIQHRTGYAADPDVRPMGIGRDLSGRRKDGTVFPVEVSLSFVPNDGELHLMALVVDITERKRTEIALRQSEEQFRSAIELAAEGVFVVNNVGEIIMVNQRAELQFGYDRDELLGQSVDVLLPSALQATHIHHRDSYMANPSVRAMGAGRELLGRRKDGSHFPIEVSLSYMRNDSQLLVMAFVADITERKQMEQERIEHEKLQVEISKERQLIELRQQFMSMISHEFRTPLTVIATTCEILDRYFDQMTDERRKERIVELNGHVQSMISLLNDILMLSKIQVGASEFSPEPLPLTTLCNKVLETAALVDHLQHKWNFSAQNSPENVYADQRLLEYILTNLLSNAIKYSPSGSEIVFAVTGQENRVIFKIQDQGRGVPKEDQMHLFEPFHRARNVGDVQGTGLGLAIAKYNVERHNGTISFHSVENEGTTFLVELPLNAPLLN